MSVNIIGWTSDDKVPGFMRQTTYGSGQSTIGAGTKKIHVCGTKTSAGSAADGVTKDVTSADEADAYFGAGSEIAMMLYAALVPGASVEATSAAEAGGAAAGTATATFSGSWTTGGTVTFWLAGRAYQVGIAATDTLTNAAQAAVDAFNSVVRQPTSATLTGAGSDVCTLTTKSKGSRCNDWVLDVDMSQAPAGLVVTLAGGSALTGGAVPFTSGSGADSVTAVISALETERHPYQAWAQYDSTALALIKTYLNTGAGPLVAHLQHAMVGSARAAATANSLSNTTINHERISNVWLLNSQWPPSMLAARIMALRSVIESNNPNYRYDGYVTGIPPQRHAADISKHAALKAALNNGVTPLLTKPGGDVVIVRGIVSKCKDGSTFDYSTLDWGEAVVPDVISDRLAAQWVTFSEANPYSGPDPGEGAQPAPEGTGTPTLWNAEVVKTVRDAEQPDARGAILLQDVDTNLPESVWDSVAKRILTACPAVVRLQNHQGGADVRQTVAL